uniref:Uncharacterized protein n=1 Tax=Zea mays TaxID=4577 RepID=B6UA67_MAIZE|nr:hypothetical protein [Zea mays]ACG48248.1 hypothetical protein [Zea mays]
MYLRMKDPTPDLCAKKKNCNLHRIQGPKSTPSAKRRLL